MGWQDNCELCDELGGGDRGLALWPSLVPDSAHDRIIDQNDSYVCLVTAGPIVRALSDRSEISSVGDVRD